MLIYVCWRVSYQLDLGIYQSKDCLTNSSSCWGGTKCLGGRISLVQDCRCSEPADNEIGEGTMIRWGGEPTPSHQPAGHWRLAPLIQNMLCYKRC